MSKVNIKEQLLYGGVSKEEYDHIRPLIAEENHRIWRVVSIILEILYIGLFIFVLVEHNHQEWVPPFGILAGVMILSVLAFTVWLKPGSKALLPFIYFSVIIMHGVFIYTGVFVDDNRPTVIFPALVVGLSFLTLDRPIRYMSTLLTTLIVFIVLDLTVKMPNTNTTVIITDILCGSIFTLAAMFISMFVNNIRTKDLVMRINAEEERDTDALTNVANKMAYDKRVPLVSQKMKEGGYRFAIAIFDVNGLKMTNDTYGHDQGDKLLIRCCNLIRDSFKNSTIYRIGGDEFVIIIEGTDYANRERILRDLYNKIDEAHQKATSLLDDTSIALGVAVYNPKQDRDYITVFSRADAQMYDNKRVTKAKNKYLQENQ